MQIICVLACHVTSKGPAAGVWIQIDGWAVGHLSLVNPVWAGDNCISISRDRPSISRDRPSISRDFGSSLEMSFSSLEMDFNL